MTITLASNNRGYALTRTPRRATTALTFEFIGDSKGCHAILNSNNATVYREIINGKATFPLEALGEHVALSVRDLKSPLDKRWECEGYIIQRDKNAVWIYPEGFDLPYELAKTRQIVDKLRGELKELQGVVDKLIKGYDII